MCALRSRETVALLNFRPPLHSEAWMTEAVGHLVTRGWEEALLRCPLLLSVAGRKQFARHEWAQKAAYLLGCSLEELSSAIFKHQPKGTLQRSTSFRQGPEENSSGDTTGIISPLPHYLGISHQLCGCLRASVSSSLK